MLHLVAVNNETILVGKLHKLDDIFHHVVEVFFPKMQMSSCMAMAICDLIHAHLEYVLAHFKPKWHAKEQLSLL